MWGVLIFFFIKRTWLSKNTCIEETIQYETLMLSITHTHNNNSELLTNLNLKFLVCGQKQEQLGKNFHHHSRESRLHSTIKIPVVRQVQQLQC